MTLTKIMNIDVLKCFNEFSMSRLSNNTVDVTVLSKYNYEYKSNAGSVEEAIDNILKQLASDIEY